MTDTIQAIQQRVDELIEANQRHKMSRKKFDKIRDTIDKVLLEDLSYTRYYNLKQKISIIKYKKEFEERIFTTEPEGSGYQDIIAHGEIIEKEKDTRILMKEGESHINIVGSELQKQISKDIKYDATTSVIIKKDRCYLSHDKRVGRDDAIYITMATEEELAKILQGLNGII